MKYFVYQTRLRGEDQYVGRLILKGVYDRAGLVDRMLHMGTSLTKTDINAVLELLSLALVQVCSEGYKVNLEGLVQVTPVLGGSFDDKTGTFAGPRNSISLAAHVSKSLKEQVVRAVTVERVILNEKRPILLDVVDSEADEGVSALTMGNILVISGKHLKFDFAQPDQYLRLVNAQNPQEFLPVKKFQKLTDHELVFRLPSAGFTEGYFELASSLNTASIRVGRSPTFPMTASLG